MDVISSPLKKESILKKTAYTPPRNNSAVCSFLKMRLKKGINILYSKKAKKVVFTAYCCLVLYT